MSEQKLPNINIIEKDYLSWIKSLSSRYRQTQIKAAVKVNQEVLRFYWDLGRDIVNMKAENRYGSNFYEVLSRDLKSELPSVTGLSETAIRYSKRFFSLYNPIIEELFPAPSIFPQLGEDFNSENSSQAESKSVDPIFPQLGEDFNSENSTQVESQSSDSNLPQLGEDFKNDPEDDIVYQVEREKREFSLRVWHHIEHDLFTVPWGHHKLIIDKCSDNPHKALFYVQQTIENGWSRSMLLNFLSVDLFERQGKAQTNFSRTLPDEMSDLAQELTKDPYNFAFTGITDSYNERIFKDALLNNITRFLIELGTGFAYVGKEYRIKVGETENFLDLLFYNLCLSCYVVIEVKIGKFTFADTGQLGGYVVACNHSLRRQGRDNPTIGLLICKEKDRLVAQYALESTSQPLGISEYELQKLYPEKVEGTIPSIKEIEEKLKFLEQK